MSEGSINLRQKALQAGNEIFSKTGNAVLASNAYQETLKKSILCTGCDNAKNFDEVTKKSYGPGPSARSYGYKYQTACCDDCFSSRENKEKLCPICNQIKNLNQFSFLRKKPVEGCKKCVNLKNKKAREPKQTSDNTILTRDEVEKMIEQAKQEIFDFLRKSFGG